MSAEERIELKDKLTKGLKESFEKKRVLLPNFDTPSKFFNAQKFYRAAIKN